jgi:hypothetical protein
MPTGWDNPDREPAIPLHDLRENSNGPQAQENRRPEVKGLSRSKETIKRNIRHLAHHDRAIGSLGVGTRSGFAVLKICGIVLIVNRRRRLLNEKSYRKYL